MAGQPLMGQWMGLTRAEDVAETPRCALFASTVPSFVAVMFTRMGLYVTAGNPGNFGILTSVISPGIINSILVFEVPANVRNAFLLCPLVCSAIAYMLSILHNYNCT